MAGILVAGSIRRVPGSVLPLDIEACNGVSFLRMKQVIVDLERDWVLDATEVYVFVCSNTWLLDSLITVGALQMRGVHPLPWSVHPSF